MKRGFTLIEVLLVASIASIVGVLLVNLLVTNNNVFYSQTTKVTESLDLNNAAATLTNDLKSAAQVAQGYPASSPTTVSSSTSLVLKLPALNSSGNALVNTYDYLVISRDPTQPVLRQRLYPDPQSSRHSQNLVLVRNLTKVNFFYLDIQSNPTSPTSSALVGFVINTSQSSQSATISLRNS